MRHRWGTCGEELVLAVGMAVVLAGWLGVGARTVIASGGLGSGMEKGSFSAEPAVSANFSVGRGHASEMMTAGWSVCWRSAGKADGRCLDIEIAWGDQVRMKSQ